MEIPDSEFPKVKGLNPLRAWRNNQFMVQEFAEPNGCIRLSINRTSVKGFRKDNSPIWADGITWDELQSIKNEIGYHDRWAVETFPPSDDVAN